MVVMLSEGESFAAPAVFAEVTWRAEGPAGAGIHLEVVTAMGDAVPPDQLRRGKDQLVVTRLPGMLVLTALPSGGGVFPPGVAVRVSVTLQASSGQAEQVVLDQVDVSGAASHELFRLQPGDDGQWTLAASAGVDDVELPGLARLAYYSARRARPDVQPGAATGPTFVLAVDVSASMFPAIVDGGVATVVEILAGIAAWAHGLGAATEVWALGADAGVLPVGLSAGTVAQVSTALLSLTPDSGASHRSLMEQLGSRGVGRVVVIGDGVPGDIVALPDTFASTRRPLSCTYLLLAHSAFDSDPMARPLAGRDELRALAPLVEGGVLSVVSVSPEDATLLRTDQRRLDLLVRALIDQLLA